MNTLFKFNNWIIALTMSDLVPGGNDGGIITPILVASLKFRSFTTSSN